MSDNKVIVHRGRTITLEVQLGFDISADTFTSEIRAEPDVTSNLLATWVTNFKTDGHDGKLTLVLPYTVSASIVAKSGYMDIKRVSGGVPLTVFDEPVEVAIRGVVTT